MKDPFAALKDALHPFFHLEPMRNDGYTYPETRQLDKALKQFEQHDNKQNFILLLKTLRLTLPRIEKWHIDFYTIKIPLDYLAKELNMPLINWDHYLAKSNTSLRFQFSTLHRKHTDPDLLPWLTAKTGTIVSHSMPPLALTRILIEYIEHFGFSQKLGAHLKKDPDFLSRLILESDKIFAQITQTRLILYLTDEQLAQAIIKHASVMISPQKNSMLQAEKLVSKLNEVLSNGRSISTLLRNTTAKFILESSELFQIYQMDQKQDVQAETVYPPLPLTERKRAETDLPEEINPKGLKI